MASVEKLPGKSRAVSLDAFLCLCAVAALGLTFAEVVLGLTLAEILAWWETSWTIRRWFDVPRIDPFWVMILLCLNTFPARFIVDVLLKRQGRSLSGKIVEVLGWTTNTDEREIGGEVFEVKLQADSVRYGRWAQFIFCLSIAALLNLVEGITGSIVWFWVAWAGILGIAVLHENYLAKEGDQTLASVDPSGISAYAGGRRNKIRRVPWSEVATCEVETFRNTIGQTKMVRPVLKRENGETIMAVNLEYVSIEDQQRLVRYLKARLPKVKDRYDPWKW